MTAYALTSLSNFEGNTFARAQQNDQGGGGMGGMGGMGGGGQGGGQGGMGGGGGQQGGGMGGMGGGGGQQGGGGRQQDGQGGGMGGMGGGGQGGGQNQQQRQQENQQRRQLEQQQRQQQQQQRQQENQQKRQQEQQQRQQQQQQRQQENQQKRQQEQQDRQKRQQEQRDDRRERQQDQREQRQDRQQQQREDRRERQQDQREQRLDRQQQQRDDRARRLDDVRGERKVTRDGNRTVIQEGNRTIVRDGNRTIIRRDESDRFRRVGRDVNVQRIGNETRTVVVGPNGQRIVTVTDANGRLLRRSRFVNNREVIIIDNRPRGGRRADAFFVVGLPVLAVAALAIPYNRYIVEAESAPPEYIYGALMAPPVEALPRAYTLDEIRYSPEVRDRMPRIDIDTITFDSGSWEISPDQYNRLAPIADGIKRAIAQNPNEVFLIEGHTDATGNDDDNLSLSDRRAESVSVILTDQFQIPPENLTTQGYGSQQMKIPSQGPERANRRVTVRRITPLLQQGQAGDPGVPPQ